uniref:Uncharacterized protein n=1 Tax=Tanacetum cinerariifolium TaxID=118510 RepID=A0A6L2MCB0_TANCI|nr:hypothetical protein [Tanacetum cinerariifolium]
MAVRQAYLTTITDSESEPFEDFKETEIPQPLHIASSPVPSSNDHYLIVGHAHTPAAIDTESELEEAPSETKTTCMAVRTQPAMSPGLSSRVTEVMNLLHLSFCNRERKESKEEGLDSMGEEAAPEGQQQQAASVEVTTVDRPLGLVYGVAKHRALELAEEIAPSTFEIRQSSRSVPDQQTLASPECSSGSLLISPASLTVPSPVASPVTTPVATIAVDEDEF